MLKRLLLLTQCVLCILANGLDVEPKDEKGYNFIYYKSENEVTSSHYRNRLDDFLAPYKTSNAHLVECVPGVPPEKGSHKACAFDINHFGPCASNPYNYFPNREGPCIFLQFEMDPDWVPEYYSSVTLPENAPRDLREHIRTMEGAFGGSSYKHKNVWLTCDGIYAADKEYLGPLDYYPMKGFGGHYFPIRNEDEYLPPIVAIRFERPMRGIVIGIECTAWAKNLQNTTVTIDLLMD